MLKTLTLILSMAVMQEITKRCKDASEKNEFARIIDRDIARYYTLLAGARNTCCERFSATEILLVTDAVRGTLWLPDTVCYLADDVEEGIEHDKLDEKWSVDGKALVAKLRELSFAQTMSFVDATERFWTTPDKYVVGEAARELLA